LATSRHPYEAWANNEKEYDMYFDLFTPNHDEVQYSYVSKDGTFEQGEQGDVEKNSIKNYLLSLNLVGVIKQKRLSIVPNL
jgi:hypothetical protein